MTRQTQTTDTAMTDSPEMDTWPMACAVLVALDQTEAKARLDYSALRDATPDNPFAKGMTGALALAQTLQDNRRRLEADMRQFARSSGLTMPELKR
jgi:hypothetical protein